MITIWTDKKATEQAKRFRARYPYIACGRYHQTIEAAVYDIAESHFEDEEATERFNVEIVEEMLAEETDAELARSYFRWFVRADDKRDYLTQENLTEAFAQFRAAWRTGDVDMEWPA